MDIWVIYRLFKNIDTGKIDKIDVIEYVKSDADARKYSRLFDLQVPVDLKEKIFHRHQVSSLYPE